MVTLQLLSAAEKATVKPVTITPLERYNYVIGTQTIGVSYQFTSDTKLVETAKAIYATGSNILKIQLGANAFRGYALPKDKTITDLVTLVTREPSVRAVLDMPFAHYLFWVEPMTGGGGPHHFDTEERKRQYREVYDLACYLLTTYNGTGKTFYLGHWEGDWLLRRSKPGGGYEDQADPQRITNMIAWLNTRQMAIDDAKRNTPHQDVQVWGYTEVNRVLDDFVPEHLGLTNHVLPQVDVDFVSYSSYDATSGNPATVRERLLKAITHIENKLRPRPGISGRRVFIGEFGTTATAAKTPEKFESLARNVFQAALELDCPLVLFWELYCNEFDKDGKHPGFWLIDDQGGSTTVHQTFCAFQREARAWVADYFRIHGQVPDRESFRRQALVILAQLPTPVATLMPAPMR
jgi:hypothetical protein